MSAYRLTHCCGVGELSGITHGQGLNLPALVARPAMRSRLGTPPGQGQIVFMDVWIPDPARQGRYTGKDGKALAAYILDNKLGTVFSAPWSLNHVHPGNGKANPAENPTGHFNKTYIWAVNRVAYAKWLKSPAGVAEIATYNRGF